MSPEREEINIGLVDVFFEETRITDIDGTNGVLRHRGRSIAELAAEPYERIAYLLLKGEWPTENSYRDFCTALIDRRDLSDDLLPLIKALTSVPADVALQTVLSSLSGKESYPDWALIALLPSIVVSHNALKNGQEIPPSDPSQNLPADFLSRFLGRPLTVLEAEIINLDFVLHADHGANASAFVARVATSTQADVYRSLTAAMAAFAGPRHGGAVEGVAAMLDGLATPDDVSSFVVGQQAAGKPVMGFGHRVYRVEDPRSVLFRRAAIELSKAQGDRSLLDKVEAAVAAMKPYERFGLSPNVDLFAAVVYRLLGLHRSQFTAIFALARTVGWLAQIREQRAGSNALIRPRLKYVGAT